MKRGKMEQTICGGVNQVKNKDKENKVQSKNIEEQKTGYGDKKLEGPDRPST